MIKTESLNTFISVYFEVNNRTNLKTVIRTNLRQIGTLQNWLAAVVFSSSYLTLVLICLLFVIMSSNDDIEDEISRIETMLDSYKSHSQTIRSHLDTGMRFSTPRDSGVGTARPSLGATYDDGTRNKTFHAPVSSESTVVSSVVTSTPWSDPYVFDLPSFSDDGVTVRREKAIYSSGMVSSHSMYGSIPYPPRYSSTNLYLPTTGSSFQTSQMSRQNQSTESTATGYGVNQSSQNTQSGYGINQRSGGSYSTTRSTQGQSLGSSGQGSSNYSFGQNTRSSLNVTNDSVNRKTVKPATFDGKSSWIDYKSHFEICADLNQWSYEDRGLYLAVSLRDQAQGVLGNLPSALRRNFDALSMALEERFAPANQNELYRAQLKERRQKASENIPELGQDIRRLTNLAYNSAPNDVKETLAKDSFIDALHNGDMRLKIRQARPRDLNDAIRHAVELEVFNRAETKRVENEGFLRSLHDSQGDERDSRQTMVEQLKEIKESMQELKLELNRLKDKRKLQEKERDRSGSDPKSDIICYHCNEKGHIRRNCPKFRQQGFRRQFGDRFPKKGGPKGVSNNIINKASVGVGEFSDAGTYLKTMVQGKHAKMLVDTGSTVTIVSENFVSMLDKKARPNICNTGQPLFSAAGTPLKVKGKASVQFQIGTRKIDQMAIIADIAGDGILGLDLLKANKFLLDLDGLSIRLGDETLPLSLEGHIGCFRIATVSTVNIPPRSEVIVEGSVCKDSGDSGVIPKMGIIETSDSFKCYEKGLVARALVEVNTTLPLRILNPTDTVQTIHKGSMVAKLSPVDVVGKSSHNGGRGKLPSYLDSLFNESTRDLDDVDREKVKGLLIRYSSLFSSSKTDIGRTDVTRHYINTGTNAPIKQPPRRVPFNRKKEIDEQLNSMLDNDVIEPSSSPWASPVVLVKKKDGSFRFCVDYRKLNNVTVKDAYPLPRIDESLDQLSGAKWFSTLDLCSGYWQVEMDADSKEKTAFTTKSGLYQFKVMPFGLCNAPATFERLMESVFRGLHYDICLIYLDDIIVTGKTIDDMIVNLTKVFDRLTAAGLKLKPSKCHLFAKTVEYLGHIITETGVSTDPSKIEVVKNWPEPTTVSELRSFLGFCSYYRRFIKDFATVAKPLRKLTEKDKKFAWSAECRK